MTKSITAYKAFDDDMTCRGFQYEVGKTYEHEGEISLYNSGFHACTVPFDCWDYHLGSMTFARVTQTGSMISDDGKTVSAKITIDAVLTLPEFIEAQVRAVVSLCKKSKNKSGDDSKLAASGDDSLLVASGDDSLLVAAGDSSHIEVSGNNSIAAAMGADSTAKAATGSWIVLAEYDSNGEVITIKSAKAGTKNVKANTWYRLENKRFVEIKQCKP